MRHHSKIIIFCSLTILSGVLNVYSQSNKDLIDKANVNIQLLEQLTKEGIDKVRSKHNLHFLKYDEICYKAAKLHAEYLVDHPISHFQIAQTKKKTPQDRVNFFGAKKYYAGENIAMIPLGVTVDRKETFIYQQAADLLVENWVNSHGHFKNIINTSYSHTAIGMYYDQKNNKLYAVQVFAQVLSFTEDKYTPEKYYTNQKNKKVKYPYRLKEIKSDKEKEIEWRNSLSSLKILLKKEGEYVYLTTFKDSKPLFNLIKNKKDGLALEYVTYTQYRCNNPQYYQNASRRTDKSFLNGEISKPVYRNQLLSQSANYHSEEIKGDRKKNAQKLFRNYKKGVLSPPYWYVSLGKPLEVDDYNEVNLILIKKKKLTDVKYYLIGSGKPLPIKDLSSLKPDWPNESFHFPKTTGTLSLNVPFELNETTLPKDEVEKFLLLDSLKKLNIKKIKIDAYASVEGTDSINFILQKKRGYWIKEYLKKELKNEDGIYQLSTSENWNLFAQQIKNSPYQYMFKLKKDSIKQILRGEVSPDLSMLLKEQRNSHIQVYYQNTNTGIDTFQICINRWDSLFNALKYSHDHERIPTINEMEILQKYLYEKSFYLDVETRRKLLKYNFPKSHELSKLINNHNWFTAHLNSDTTDTFIENVTFCGTRKDATNIEKYNYLVYLLQQEQKTYPHVSSRIKNIERIEKTIDWTEFSIKDRMTISYNLNLILVLYHSKRIKDHDLSSNYYARLVQEFSYKSNEDTLNMAQMHLYMYNTSATYNLLKHSIDNNTYNKDILKLFLIVSYQHYNFPLGVKHIYPYYNLLVKYKNELTPEEWCGLFRKANRISFQSFDHEMLRKLYCESCADIEMVE